MMPERGDSNMSENMMENETLGRGFITKEQQNIRYEKGVEKLISQGKKRLSNYFDEIVNLDNLSIQRIIREINIHDLSKSLKMADDKVRNKIFRNLTNEMLKKLRENMEKMESVTLRDIEEAQGVILTEIIELNRKGEIPIPEVLNQNYEDIICLYFEASADIIIHNDEEMFSVLSKILRLC
jgi:hypothetical protein